MPGPVIAPDRDPTWQRDLRVGIDDLAPKQGGGVLECCRVQARDQKPDRRRDDHQLTALLVEHRRLSSACGPIGEAPQANPMLTLRTRELNAMGLRSGCHRARVSR